MLFDYWDVFRTIFNWVPESAAIMMVLSGVMAISWLGYERKRRGSFLKRSVEAVFDVTLFLKILSYLGLVIGVFVIWSGVASLILDIPPSFKYEDVYPGEGVNHFTSIFLIFMGIAMFFKPISDLPLASILGLIIASAVALLVASIVPDTAVQLIGNFINPKWVLIAIFAIVAIVVALTARFYLKTLQRISKFLSWPPIAFVVMIFCLIQGFSLWFTGYSIFGTNLL
jgi:H+/Cl- antiporter ClcA